MVYSSRQLPDSKHLIRCRHCRRAVASKQSTYRLPHSPCSLKNISAQLSSAACFCFENVHFVKYVLQLCMCFWDFFQKVSKNDERNRVIENDNRLLLITIVQGFAHTFYRALFSVPYHVLKCKSKTNKKTGTKNLGWRLSNANDARFFFEQMGRQ